MNLLKPILLFVVATVMTACADNTNNENDRFSEFRTWWNENTANIENSTEEEWQEFKTEFKAWRDSLRQDDLNEDQKTELSRMDEQFTIWDREYSGTAEARRDNTAVAPDDLEAVLLNNTDLANISPADVRPAYVQFMENVRAQKDNWNETHWDAAERIFQRLQEARDRNSEQLSTEDKARIAALETEYRTLETANDVADAVQ